MKTSKKLRMLSFPVLLFLAAGILFLSSGQLYSMIAAQWDIIDYIDHGTRRLVVIDDNRWFFYRSEPDEELTLKTEEGKIMIKTAVRQNVDEITYQVRIGNVFRNFTAKRLKTSGDFSVMEDVYLNLGPGVHKINISTPNRLAYFKVFREEEVWAVPTERRAFTPERYQRNYTLMSEDTESPYYSATNSAPVTFNALGPNEVLGFARYFINNADEEGVFDIVVNNRVIETVTIPSRRTGSYWLEENPDQELSIGRRFEFDLPAGEHRVQLIPRSEDTFIFRTIMDVPEDLPEPDDPVYDIDAFDDVPVIREALSGLQITVGSSLRYEDNVFSLSDRDIDRFDGGDDRFDFIDTRDDFVINPFIRMRYPFNFGEYEIEPYINFNYRMYMNNEDKSNYFLLTGLFNTYKNFNLNLYYGYYADIYVRNYFTDGGDPDIGEKFEYDRNFYRIYPFFRLTRHDTVLLDYRYEEYYHNEHFTEYDGTANTFGFGWRRSFPTFFLRAFYYYREFDGTNITPDDDPSYQSNIYDFEFRNKRTELFGTYDFRPFIGFRYEDRFFSKEYVSGKVGRFDYQSSRNDRRYSFTVGSEFYLTDNLDVILDYNYFLRDSTSENPNVSRDKDYNEQTINLTFEYTLRF